MNRRKVRSILLGLSVVALIAGLVTMVNMPSKGVVRAGAPGPLEHWRLEEGSGSTAASNGSSGTVGTLVGPTWTGGSPGQNFALEFDGNDDRVDIGNLDVSGSALTIAAWFKVSAFTIQDGRIISKASGTAADDHFWMLSTVKSGSEFRLRSRLKAGGSTTTLIPGSGNIPTGQWIHAAMVYDGNVLRLYQDGVEVASTALNGSLGTDPTVAAAIGNQPPESDQRPWSGCIDDVRIYSASLSPVDIADLAQVAPPNLTPTAADDAYDVDAGQTLVVAAGLGVLDNDSDFEGDPLSAILIDDVDDGSLSLSGDGGFTYTPDPGFSGLDIFTYRANDGTSSSNLATARITVNAIPLPPFTNPDTATVVRGLSVAIPVLANDTDDNDLIDPASIVVMTPPLNGMTVLDPVTGVLTYTHDGSATFSDSFGYTVRDTGGLLSAEALVSLTVDPVVQSGLVMHLETDSGLNLLGQEVASWVDQSPFGNDLLPDGNPVVLPAELNGQDVIRLDGDDDLLQRTVAESGGLNGFPLSNTDRSVFLVVKYDSNGPGGFGYGVASCNNVFSLIVVGGDLMLAGWCGSSSFLTMEPGTGEGFFTHSAILGSDTFTHYKNGIGIDSASHVFDTADGDLVLGSEVNTGTYVQMEIAAILVYNRALLESERMQVEGYLQDKYLGDTFDPLPVADPDFAAVEPGGTVSITVLDGDFDNSAIDPTTVTIVDPPSFGTATPDPLTGDVVYVQDGGMTALDSFTYTVNDDVGQTSLPATVTIAVTSDDCPLVTSGLVLHLETDANITIEGTDIVIGWGDQSGEGNDLVNASTPRLIPNALNGRDVIRFDGDNDTLTRMSGVTGLPEGNADRTVIVVTNYLDDGPGGFGYGTASCNQAFSLITVPGGNLMLAGWCQESSFLSNAAGTGAGWLIQSARVQGGEFRHYKNGLLIDTGSHQFNTINGSIAIGTEVNDGSNVEMEIAAALIYDRALSDSELQEVENYLYEKYFAFPCGDTPPIALDDFDEVLFADSVVIDVLANDLDQGGIDPTTVEILLDPSNGLVTVDPTTGLVTYEHDGADVSPDSFTYRVTDGIGAVSNEATVHLAIDDPLCPPVTTGLVMHLDAGLGVVEENGLVSSWTDLSPAGNDVVSLSGAPRQLLGAINGRPAVRFDGIDDVMGRGSLSGFPTGPADRSIFIVSSYVSGNAGFSYGAPACNQAFGPIVGPGGELTVQGFCPPNDFPSTEIGLGDGFLVQSVVLSGNNLRHYRDGNLIDSQTHTFATASTMLRIADELNSFARAEMLVAEVLVFDRAVTELERDQIGDYLGARYFAQACNEAPLADPEFYSLTIGTNLVVNAAGGVLANDADPEGLPLTAILVDDVTNGTLTLNPDGSFTYVPTIVATETFTYRASDGVRLSPLTTVTLDVVPLPVGGLEHHYKFDEGMGVTANDSAGSTNGTIQGLTHGSNTPDGSPFALVLDGTDDELVDLGVLDFTGDEITIALWLKPSGFGIADARLISRATGGAPSSHFWMLSTIRDGSVFRLRARLKTGGETSTLIADSGELTLDTWTHAAMVYNGTTLTLYQDGQPVGSLPQTGSIDGSGTVRAAIGNQPMNAGDKPFDGCLDDVRLYSRALTSGELLTLASGEPVNQPPTVVDDNYSMDPNLVLTVNAPGVLDNDFDPEGDSFTAQLVSDVSNGALNLNPDGSFTYTPNLNFSDASDSFTYVANDATGSSSEAIVLIDVGAIPGVPTTMPDSYGTMEGATLIVAEANGVLANDADPDLDPLTAILMDDVSNGTLMLAPDGSFQYVPNPAFFGQDSFTYVADDGNIPSSETSVMITVSEVPAPVAFDDMYSAQGTQLLAVNSLLGVLANDMDPQMDPLSTILVQTTANGTLALGLDGSFTYSSNPGFFGVDTFTYRATDGTKQSGIATVSITVAPTGGAGLEALFSFEEGSGETAGDSSGNSNDGSISGAQFVMDSADQSVYSLNFDGENDLVDLGALDVSGEALTIALWLKPDDFDEADGRLISRATGGAASSHLWMISTIKDGDFFRLRARLKTDGSTSTLIATSGVLQVGTWTHAALVYDGATLTIYHDGAAAGSLAQTGSIDTSAIIGVAIGNQPPGVARKPFHGCIDDVRIYSRALLSMEVLELATGVPVNQAPVAFNDLFSMAPNTTLSEPAGTGVLSNDQDNEGDLLTATLIGNPSNGSVTLNLDGSFDYTPSPNFGGASDTFTYVANDAGGTSNVATVTIDVDPVPGVPTAMPDMYGVMEGMSLTVNAALGVLTNDDDPDLDPLTAVLETDVSSGTLALAADGSFVYMPNPNFFGVDSFTYRADDGNLPSAPATVTISVAEVPDPVALNDNYMVTQGQALLIAAPGVLGNDSDPQSDPLMAQLVQDVSNGTLQFNADGSFTYTPAGLFFGTDTFTYYATDGGSQSPTATVSIDVVPGVGANLFAYYPFEEGTGNVAQDGSGGGNDGSIQGPEYVMGTADQSVYALRFSGEDNEFVDLGALNPSGSALSIALWFKADDFGVTDARLISRATGGAPSSHFWMLSTIRDGSVFRLRARLKTNGDTTTLIGSGGELTPGQWIHGALVYDGTNLELFQDGSLVASVPLTGSIDTSGTVAAAIGNQPPGAGDKPFDGCIDDVRIYERALLEAEVSSLAMVIPPNFAPVAGDNGYTIDANTVLSTDALSGVLVDDTDAESDPLTAILGQTTSNGTLQFNVDGTFTYTPDLNFGGADDTFTYQASDGMNPSNVATVTITVRPIPGVPTANPDFYVVDENGSLTVDALMGVLDNDFDPDSDPLMTLLESDVSNGSLSLDPSGSFTYTPNPGFFGMDQFEYRANDGNVPSAPTLVTIDVNETPAPTAGNDSYSATSGETLTITALFGVLVNDNDPQGDPLTAVLDQNVGSGMLSLGADGSFTYTSNNGFFGTDTFTYRATDGLKLSNVATVTITVAPAAGSDLRAWYPFEEGPGATAADASGNGNDGVIVGGSYGPDTPDESSFSLCFNGNDDEYADLGVLDIGGPTLTIALWFKPDSFEVPDARFISRAFSNSPSGHYWMVSTVPVGAEIFVRSRLRTDGDVTTVVAGSGALQVGEWVHVALVYDGTTHRLYKDGQLVGSSPQTGDVDTSVAVLAALGNQPPGTADKPFDGCLDDVRIYDRALALAEILALASGDPGNEAPMAVNDSYSGEVDAPLGITALDGVLFNDTDPESDPLTATLVGLPSDGSLALSVDGSFTYTPDPGFAGTDSFTYRATDGSLVSNLATVTLTITPPLFTSGLVAHYDAALGLTLENMTVTGWDDQSGQANHLSSFSTPELVPGALNGHPVISFDGNADRLERTGAISGLPQGDADRTVFMVCKYLNTGPGGFGYGTSSTNQAFSVIVAPNGNLMVTGWGGSASFDSGVTGSGTDWLVQSARHQGGVLDHFRDGQLIDSQSHTFATVANRITVAGEVNSSSDVQMDIAEILVYDTALSETDRGLVEVYLQAKYFGGTTDPAPQANSDFASVEPGGTVLIDILDNDDDNGSIVPGTVVITQAPSFGGISVDPVTGAVTYMQTGGASSLDTFRYTVEDDQNQTSNEANVTIQINSGACPLIANGLVLHLESDFGLDLEGAIVTRWADQSGRGNNLTNFSTPTRVPNVLNGQPVISFDGNADRLEKTGSLNGLPQGNADRTMFVVARYLDSGPGGVGWGNPSTNQAFSLIAAPPSGNLMLAGWGGSASFLSTEPGTGEGFMIQSARHQGGTFEHFRDGTVIDSAIHSFNTVNTRLTVGGEINSSSSVEMDIAAVLIYDRALSNAELAIVASYLQDKYFAVPCGQTPPDVNDDFAGVNFGSQVAIDVLANDSDTDGLDLTSVEIASTPGKGTVSVDPVTGVITYDHQGMDILSDSFTYTVADLNGQVSSVATVYVAVDDPICNLFTGDLVLHLDASQGLTTSGSLVTAWEDQSSSGNDVTPFSAAPGLILNAANGRPAVRFDGTNDSLGRANPSDFPTGDDDRTIFVVVDYLRGNSGVTYGSTACNQAFGPIVDPSGNLGVQGWCPENDFATTTSAFGVGLQVHAVVLDDDMLLQYQNGSLIDAEMHSFATTDAMLRIGEELNGANFVQMDIAEILIYDRALSTAQRLQVEAYFASKYFGQPCNQPPAANDDIYGVPDGGVFATNAATGVLANDNDLEGDPLVVMLVDDVTSGSLTLNADGSFSYTPGMAETTQFTYQVSDGTGLSDVATVTLNLVPQNLLAHWRFDEGSGSTASDSSGNGNTGTVSGAAWAAGNVGSNSLNFDGDDDAVNLGPLQATGSAMTITLWLKADDFDQQDARLVSRAIGGAASSHLWMLSTIEDNGSIRLRARIKTDGDASTLIGTGALVTGQWIHAAMVYDGSTLKVYQDGVEVGSLAATGPIDNNATWQAAIGNQPSGVSGKPFDGCLDDVRIYSRALGAAEIQSLASTP